MKIIRHVLLFLIIAVMLLPLVQQRILHLSMRPLVGVQDTLSDPKFTFSKFFDLSYQEQKSSFLDEKAGFRPFLIRLKNQVDYSVFNYTQSGGVVIGEERCLFLKSYINNYCGIEFQGVRRIDFEVKRLALVGQELKKKNVDLLLILAPGKASFNQELIPSRYHKNQVTNYEYYSKRLSVSGLNVIDMNKWFRQLKQSTPYPLFPRNGVHWTSYAVGLAADSMVRYIEKLRNIDMPEMSYDKVHLSDTLKYSDNDAGDLMNLMCNPVNIPMPYPEFTYRAEGKHRPDVITIADSYWWGFITTGVSRNVFGKARYWFYGKDIYEDESKIGTVAAIDIHQELEKQEVVIMLVTEATWMLFPFGFTDAYLKDFKPETMADKELQVEMLMDKIRRDPAWYRSIVEKAGRNNLSTEEQLRKDALYMIELENKGK
jgi:hypothetical protein